MSNKTIKYRPITESEKLICNSLLHVSVLPGTPKKKFINTIPALLTKNLVSENQINYILHLFYHYRRQIKDYSQILESLPQSQQKKCCKEYFPAK